MVLHGVLLAEGSGRLLFGNAVVELSLYGNSEPWRRRVFSPYFRKFFAKAAR